MNSALTILRINEGGYNGFKMMNHPHHHHPHHHHHPPHHPHAHGVAIGPLPNPCIGMVAAPTAAGPVLAGIGVPIMTAAAPTLVPPPPQMQPHNSGPSHHPNGPKKMVMSADSSVVDDKDKCPAHPFIQTRTSPSTATVVVSCSAGPGQGGQLTWTSPTGPGGGPMMPAGIAYPVMGLPPDPTGAATAGMIYGVPIQPADHSQGVNSVISMPNSSAPVGVQPPPPPPTAISISTVIPTQNNPGVVGSTTLSPLGGGQQAQPLSTASSAPSVSANSQNSLQQPQQQQQQPTKEIIHCKSCTLFPPNPNAPPPTTREKPPGCRTAFVGGLPENIREDIVREIFERCGEITTIRMSKKNFCHIRFEMEQFVESALYLSGYRIRIGSNSDSVNIGRLHVDYAQARDDLYEWECRQRQLLREQRHRERLEQERLQPPSPPPAVHFSDHEAANVAERIKGDDTFMKAIQILFSWLEKGECLKRNSNTFYSMIQSTNSQVRRLLNEKSNYEEDFQKAKDLLRQRVTGLLMQFTQIEKVFSAACQRKVWDHFSKAQRKNIEVWKKQAAEIKSVLLEEALNERADEEMELSDLESDSSGQSNKENGEPPRAKKMRLSAGMEDAAKTVHQLKEENDALRCQLEASKNEVDLIKADLRTELEMKDQQLRSLQQQVLAVQRNVSTSPPSTDTLSTGASSGGDSGITTMSPSGTTSTAPGSTPSGSATTTAGMAIKQNLHSPPVSVSSSSSPGFGASPTPNHHHLSQMNSGGGGGNGTEDMSRKTESDNNNSNKNPGGSGSSSQREFQGFCDSSSCNSNNNNNSASSIVSLQPQSAQNNQHNQQNSGSSSGNNGSLGNDNPLHNGNTNKNESSSAASNTNNNNNSALSGVTGSESEGNVIGICEKEARLLGIISTFLHVHPFGASLDYIWSYAQKVLPMVRPNQIEVLMTKFPSLFKQEMSGIGATFERKWVFVGFS